MVVLDNFFKRFFFLKKDFFFFFSTLIGKVFDVTYKSERNFGLLLLEKRDKFRVYATILLANTPIMAA